VVDFTQKYDRNIPNTAPVDAVTYQILNRFEYMVYYINDLRGSRFVVVVEVSYRCNRNGSIVVIVMEVSYRCNRNGSIVSL